MAKIKITVEYDGTQYGGWQRQLNAPSIQQELEEAWQRCMGEQVRMTACGRTDAGVHAMGQVVHFVTANNIAEHNVVSIFNGNLPQDIIVKSAEFVPDDFSARFDAKSKTYVYVICNAATPSALWCKRSCYIPQKLDIDAMKSAAALIVGEHDFSCFKASGGSTVCDVRTVNKLKVEKKSDFVVIEINGNGFLYNMVRIIAGTLAYVGMGKLKPQDITDIILAKDRTKAGKTLPPQGLYLKEVFY